MKAKELNVKQDEMKILNVDVLTLRPAKYNPRVMTDKEKADLKRSISEFGFVEPLVVNAHKGRLNTIIGGHQRFKIAQELGYKKVPVFYINCDEEEEKKLNIRLNKNLGNWDYELLMEIDPLYIDVIIERWENLTNNSATKVK